MDNENKDTKPEENTQVPPDSSLNDEKISEPAGIDNTNIEDEPVTFEEPKEEVYIPLQHPDKNFPFYSNVDKRIYNNARALAIKILVRCERSDAYLDKIIDFELRQNDLNDKDKALLNEIAHGCVRWLRRLDWFLNGFYRGQYEKCMSDVKNAMRVALYQILFLNKIPYAAAVNESVEYIKKVRTDKHAGVVNGVMRTLIRTLDSLVWPTREIDEVNYLGIVQSHPNWLVRRWVQRFGFDEAEKLCAANNIRPKLTLRVNRTKITTEQLENHLKELGIEYKRGKYLDYFVHIRMMSRIYDDEFFKKGYFTIQDESAGLMSQLLNPSDSDLVFDVCAAPGGKSSHISELMNGKGRIIAIDKYQKKAEIMKGNFQRLGITNILAFHEDLNEPRTDMLKEKIINGVDKVLVDAPCSGLGVLTKKPDIKWKRESEDILKLQNIQIEILEKASQYVKPGGVLVYSTCTTEPEENEEVVMKFLDLHTEFKVDSAAQYVSKEVVNEKGFIEVFPHRHNIDGAFGARLIKAG